MLYEAPLRSDEPARTTGLRNRLREAYMGGYQDGRKRDQKNSGKLAALENTSGAAQHRRIEKTEGI